MNQTKRHPILIIVIAALAFVASCRENPTNPDDYTVATPIIDPAGGSYSTGQLVSISCATSCATIRYTTNGSVPGATSTIYHGPIYVSSSATFKAKGFKDGWIASATASATYTFQVAAPEFTPVGGTFTTMKRVTISCATSEATIKFTTDGSEPGLASMSYTAPIDIYKTTTFKARAFKDGLTSSPTVSSTYIIKLVAIPMLLVPGGNFTMGDSIDDEYGSVSELPPHSVSLDPFYIGKYEITQSEYAAVMGSIPPSESGVGDNYPVYRVSWYSAIKYCNLRSSAESLTPVYSISGYTNPADWGDDPDNGHSDWNSVVCNFYADGYRLPTEAEWEYAARGATNDPDFLFAGSDDLDAVAWYGGNNSPQGSKPVGTKSPNGIGIHDMSGNLWEWCWDWYLSAYYGISPSDSPSGPAFGSDRVIRGGDWFNSAEFCRVTRRFYYGPNYTGSQVGFRVCRSALFLRRL